MVTFGDYLRLFKSLKGLFAGAIGVAGAVLWKMEVIAPPDEACGILTVLVLGFALMAAYIVGRLGRLGAHGGQAAAAVTLALGGALAGLYLLHLMKIYIHTDCFHDKDGVIQVRVVVGDKDGYSELAERYVSLHPGISKCDLITKFTLSDLDTVFTEDSLYWARFKLVLTYILSLLLVDIGFCFLVYADAIHGAAPPTSGPGEFTS